jgi:Uma2 family endonuclease
MVEIKVPEGKPAFEWVNGRALQKVSPKRKHSLAQGSFLMALGSWARSTGTGFAGPEWRFRIQPPGEVRRPLVPDVAFLSYKRLPRKAMEKTEEPLVAPNAVVEVKSPSDRRPDVEEKIRVYLAAGTDVVFLVDPQERVLTVYDADGKRQLTEKDTIKHQALPGFRLKVKTLFELPRPKK